MGKGKQNFQGKQYKTYKKYSKLKKLVTGEGPTLLEKISGGVGAVADVAKAVLPAIMAINTELKYYDETASFVSYNTASAPDLRCLTDALTQGTGDSNRIGNSILAKNIQIRLAMSMPFSANANPPILGQHHRFMILCWKFNDSGGPSVAKILESPSNIYSAINKDYSDQFVILKDKFMTFNCNFGTSSAGTVQTGDFKALKYFKDLQFHLRWNDAGNAIANHIYILSMSTASSINNAIGTTFYSRLNYTDN